MKKSLILALSVAAFSTGCGKKGEDPDKYNPSTPLTEVSETLKMGDSMTFKASIPQGLERKSRAGGAMVAFEDPVSTINGVSVRFGITESPARMEDAIKELSPRITLSTKKEFKPGDRSTDWVVAGRSPNDISAEAKSMFRTGKYGIECTATYFKSAKAKADLDAMAAYVQRICESVKPAVPAAPVAEAPAASAEMQDFIRSCNGKSTSVAAALKKYGVPKLNTQDMEMFNLSDAKIVKTSQQGSMTCHDMHAKSGATTRGYTLCWDKAKIKEVKALGAGGLMPFGT